MGQIICTTRCCSGLMDGTRLVDGADLLLGSKGFAAGLTDALPVDTLSFGEWPRINHLRWDELLTVGTRELLSHVLRLLRLLWALDFSRKGTREIGLNDLLCGFLTWLKFTKGAARDSTFDELLLRGSGEAPGFGQ